MPSLELQRVLAGIATELAETRLRERGALERERRELEEKLRSAQMKLGVLDLIEQRRNNYLVAIRDKDLCPHCAISEGVDGELRPSPSETEVDLFKCRMCKAVIEVEM